MGRRPYHDGRKALCTRAVSPGCPRRNDRMSSRSTGCCCALWTMLIAALPVAAMGQDSFYAGKTVTTIVDGGGAYEAYARMLARHMPKYIPGHPNIIVQQMPGAGGVRAASF